MRKVLAFLLSVISVSGAATAATKATNSQRPAVNVSEYVDKESYAAMYPYLSNKMRQELDPGVMIPQTNNPIDVLVKTKEMPKRQRRVVPRKTTATPTVRAATTPTQTRKRNVVARSAATTGTATGAPKRRVVPRVATTTMIRGSRTTAARSATNTTQTEYVSTSRCLADYTECMNSYCERANTLYNRCFCSSKLAQIDSVYQDDINNLINQIIILKNGGETWTQEEMNEYWMNTVGKYFSENSFTNLENALNIEWPTNENRTRGQQAFVTGHNYCSQNLRACASVASNLRDAYRSRISRDCQEYENTLIKIKTAAESTIQHYSE